MQDIFCKVCAAFNSVFDVDPQLISMDTGPGEIPAWDSMGHLALAASLESTFKINLDVDELMEMEDVRQIVRIIGSKLNPRPA